MAAIIDKRLNRSQGGARCHQALILSLLVLGFWVVGAGSMVPSGAQASEADATLRSIATGGRLYDNWARELEKRRPKNIHPLYPADGPLADEPAETWRCVVCHGWDYRGSEGIFRSGPNATGIKGISGMAGAPEKTVIKAIAGGKHGYDRYFDKKALKDIAAFVRFGQVPMRNHIDEASGRVKGEPTGSAELFATVCGSCHGVDGTAMQEIPSIGDETRDDPWQGLHKMLNGHPGDAMPALRVFDMASIVDLLAYQQTLPSADALIRVTRSGMLYDDWGREIKFQYPKTPHPAWPKNRKVAPGTSSWRCVECHGWDYKGTEGIKGITGMAGADPRDVMNVLADETHRVDKTLKHKDLWDLATFVTRGQIDMGEFIEPGSGKARGAKTKDLVYFSALCATCHGEDGTEVRTMPAMGRVAKDNPWKALHKILNGHPGETMPSWQVALTPQGIKDMMASLQSLPEKRF